MAKKNQIYYDGKNITNDVYGKNISILNYEKNDDENESMSEDEKKYLLKDLEVLRNPDYLKNYYYDMYGNRIESSLIDYYADYITTKNNDYPKAKGVKIKKGRNNMIQPDLYHMMKHKTNVYNIDWSRIINPMTAY